MVFLVILIKEGQLPFCMELRGLGIKSLNYGSISDLFRKKPVSLEQMLINANLDPNSEINKQRLAFEFPEDFDFKEPEFKKDVLYLFNRHEFYVGHEIDETLRNADFFLKKKAKKEALMLEYNLSEKSANKLSSLLCWNLYVSHLFNRKEFHSYAKKDKLRKKAVRNIYQKKAEKYLVNHHKWPKKITERTTKGLSLPAYNEKDLDFYLDNTSELVKDFPKLAKRGTFQGLEILSACSVIGNYPARFANPTAKFLNIKRKTMTRLNILYDIGMFVIEYGPAYAMAKDISENGIFDGDNVWVDITKMLGYVYYGIHMITRTAQIPIRTYFNEVKDKHLASYATANSPNPLMAVTTIPPIMYDYIITRKEKKDQEVSTSEIKQSSSERRVSAQSI